MDKAVADFLECQKHKPLVWFRFIDDISFIWTHRENELEHFLKELNKTHPNLIITHESSKEKISFLDLSVRLSNGKLYTDLYIEATGFVINILNTHHLIQIVLRNQ